MARLNSAGVVFSKGAKMEIAAKCTQVSSRPYLSAVVSATAFTPSKSVTSATTSVASPPARLISPTSESSPSLLRAETTTLAPFSANRRAVSRPMPLEAPISATTCRSTGFSFIVSSFPDLAPPVSPGGDRAPHSAFVAAELVIYAVHPAELAEGVETFDRWRRTIGHVTETGDTERAALEEEAFEKSLVRLLGLGCHVGKQGAGVTLLIQSREDDA